MELSQIKKAKAEAEKTMMHAILAAASEFKLQTGLSFKNISVELLNVRQIQDEVNTYVPVSVNCEVDYD